MKIGPGRKPSSFPSQGQSAGQVRGQHVGRELDPARLEPTSAAHRRREERLGHPGRALEQEVAPDRDRDHRRVDDMGLTDDHFVHLLVQSGTDRCHRVRVTTLVLGHDHLPLCVSVA